jgi:hypothetical protein
MEAARSVKPNQCPLRTEAHLWTRANLPRLMVLPLKVARTMERKGKTTKTKMDRRRNIKK